MKILPRRPEANAISRLSDACDTQKSNVAERVAGSTIAPEFVTRDARVLEALEVAAMVADSDATVLIRGESGTGKELLAKALHDTSARCGRPFVAVNCAALAETLQESELFGHVSGAFTGANERKVGRFEAADGGTIFLDEISEAKGSLQAQLLRVLQSGEYAPVGSAVNRSCNVRVVAASNRRLEELIQCREFRADLFYRLNVIALEIPPLRERRGDIPLLIEHFGRRFGQLYSRPDMKLTPRVVEMLSAYSFPGNVRELENLVRRFVLLYSGRVITERELPRNLVEPAASSSAWAGMDFHAAKEIAIRRFEREFLTSALDGSAGIVSRAARSVGLSERNFHVKLKQYGIAARDFRPGECERSAQGAHPRIELP